MRLTRMMLAGLGLLLLSGLLLACQEEAPTPAPTAVAAVATATERPAEATATATTAPTATPRPTATPQPTPLVAGLLVEEQSLTEAGLFVVAQVVAPEPVWVLLMTVGEPATVLGEVAVPAGVHENLTIELDPYRATSSLDVALFRDVGLEGVFEADLDEPLDVRATVAVALDVTLPGITVSEQTVGEDGLVLIDSVIAVTPGWLALFGDADGEPGELLAFAPIKAGLNEAVPLFVNRYVATTTLHVVLFGDGGESGRFEPEVDEPVRIGGVPVAVSFAITLPLDILAYDQLPFDDQIVLERVVVPVEAWVAVYFDDNGQLGRVIGFAELDAGVNENVVVPVETSLVTPILLITIHQDLGEPGVFDFPGDDALLAVDGQIPAPYELRTNPGNYLLTVDQPLGEGNTIMVPLALIDLPGWVVVYADAAGELGDIVGFTQVGPGLLRDVAVTLDGASPGETYHVVLHVDNAELGVFEPPAGEGEDGGNDIPFQRNRAIIRAPFQLLAN